MASLYQLLLSILRLVSLIIIAVQSYTPKFPEGLCSLSIKHALSGARKSLNAFGSTGGSLCCRIPGHTLSSPSALFTTPEGISSDEKSPNFIQRKKESKLPDLSPLTFSDFHSVTRTQANDEIKHLELYLKWRKGGTF